MYDSETDSEKCSKSSDDTQSDSKSGSGDESSDIESGKLLRIVNLKEVTENSYEDDPINRIDLTKIKENKNTKPYVFTNHQDLQKYDDNNMKLQLNFKK